MNYIDDGSEISTEDKDSIVLREFLQSGSTMTLELATSTIEACLPDNDPLSNEVYSLYFTCIQVAEQMPYEDPSHLKLAGLLENLASSPKLGKADGNKVCCCSLISIFGSIGPLTQMVCSMSKPGRGTQR